MRPISMNKANAWLGEHHRHLKRELQGWLFGVEIQSDEGERLGVACAARPARNLQDGVTLDIKRVCTLGARNACSFAYGALRRAGRALGYTRIYTYTRQDEPGISTRAAGFACDGPAGGGQGTRPSRPRPPTEDPSEKRRWVWPPSLRTGCRADEERTPCRLCVSERVDLGLACPACGQPPSAGCDCEGP